MTIAMTQKLLDILVCYMVYLQAEDTRSPEVSGN